MAIERKKYWKEGSQWKCETSYYHPETDNTSTAFVRDVEEADVPPEFRADAAAAGEIETSPSQEGVAPATAAPAKPPRKPRQPKKSAE